MVQNHDKATLTLKKGPRQFLPVLQPFTSFMKPFSQLKAV
jgi:hypothetical protein